jgi:hypothetical protein
LASDGTAAQPRHLGVGAGLIDEDELVRIKINLRRKPRFARRRNVGPLLLGGVRGFF